MFYTNIYFYHEYPFGDFEVENYCAKHEKKLLSPWDCINFAPSALSIQLAQNVLQRLSGFISCRGIKLYFTLVIC